MYTRDLFSIDYFVTECFESHFFNGVFLFLVLQSENIFRGQSDTHCSGFVLWVSGILHTLKCRCFLHFLRQFLILSRLGHQMYVSAMCDSTSGVHQTSPHVTNMCQSPLNGDYPHNAKVKLEEYQGHYQSKLFIILLAFCFIPVYKNVISHRGFSMNFIFLNWMKFFSH